MILALNVYVLATPFLPQVTFRIENVINKDSSLETTDQRAELDRSTDKLFIPRLHMEQKIWVGQNENLVHKGVWQIPHSSTPDKGSNTVLVGHRFSYKDPAVFYHLDKLQINDVVVVSWGGKLYNYKVSEVKIVQPEAVEIEQPTEDDILTLYTCNPLWSTKERLVVISNLESVE